MTNSVALAILRTHGHFLSQPTRALALAVILHACVSTQASPVFVPNDFERAQPCWKVKGGACVRVFPSSAAPCLAAFKGATTWWRGCPKDYRCCIPASGDKHWPIISQKCGYRASYERVARSSAAGQIGVVHGQIPWQAALYEKVNGATASTRFVCSGSIINPEWVATAAHCLRSKDPHSYEVEVGVVTIREVTHKGSWQKLSVKKILIHEEYKGQTEYDFALVQVTPKVKYDDNTQAICLPRYNDNFENVVCMVGVWGNTIRNPSTHLKAVLLPTWTQTACSQKKGQAVAEMNICAGFEQQDRNPCLGDSGAGLACRMNSGQWLLAGVASTGPDDCNTKAEPSVFTKLTKFVDWVEIKTAYFYSK